MRRSSVNKYSTFNFDLIPPYTYNTDILDEIDNLFQNIPNKFSEVFQNFENHIVSDELLHNNAIIINEEKSLSINIPNHLLDITLILENPINFNLNVDHVEENVISNIKKRQSMGSQNEISKNKEKFWAVILYSQYKKINKCQRS